MYTPLAMRVRASAFAIGTGVAVAYVVAAQLGFRMAFTAEQVTTVWAPTGIAIAALLLRGLRFWPAVWGGAFAANLSTSAPTWTAAGIATGNTLEAVVAAWALSRRSGFDPAMRRTRDVLAYLLLAGGLGCAIAATSGVSVLCAAGVQPWASYWPLWSDWMLGDALGAIVVGPAILTTFRPRARLSARQRLETVLLLVMVIVGTTIVFGGVFATTIGSHPIQFVLFPFVLTAAVRLGQPATAVLALAVSAVAIWNTFHGRGPFVETSVHQSLVVLQVFLGVLASSGLLLSAAVTERRIADERRGAPNPRGVGGSRASSPRDA
ncbi:MAG TPA: MASE1 domain-containing protein, partial [Vicinamibacterales bacterium]|nr:MASE1 domain-containing protein [Vicinamibacterales bacterium]